MIYGRNHLVEAETGTYSGRADLYNGYRMLGA